MVKVCVVKNCSSGRKKKATKETIHPVSFFRPLTEHQIHLKQEQQQNIVYDSSEELMLYSFQLLDNVKKKIEKSSILPPYWFFTKNMNEFMHVDPISKRIRNHILLNEDFSITVICSKNKKVTLDVKIASFTDITKYLKSVVKWPLCVGTQLSKKSEKIRKKLLNECKVIIFGEEAYKRFQINPRCKSCLTFRKQLLTCSPVISKEKYIPSQKHTSRLRKKFELVNDPIRMAKIDGIVQPMLCMACLCVDRSLRELKNDKLRQYYLDTLSEIPQLSNQSSISPIICWECEALLKKMLSFREQVKDSYRILQTYAHENLYECLLSDVSRPPRLKVHINDSITITPEDDKDKVPKEEVKIELNDEPQNIALHNYQKLKIPAKDSINTVHTSSEAKKEKIRKHKFSDKDFSETVHTSSEAKKEKIRTKKQNSNSNLTNEKSKPPILKTQANTISTFCVSEGNEDKDTMHLDLTFESEICKEEQKKLDTDEYSENEVLDNVSQTSDCGDVEIEVDKTRSIQEIKERAKNIVKSKLQNAKKIVKRLQCAKKRQPQKEAVNEKILTLELTYDEMLAERERESKRESYVKAQYKCETCLIGFHYNKSYRAHSVAKHSPDIGDYSCPICKTVIASVESFTAHYKRHLRRYECSICRKRTIDLKAMQQHYYSTHEISLKEYKCNLCGQISNSIDTHRYHKDTHKARVQCDECDKTFSHRAGLMNHRLAVHESQNEFPCTVCDKVFRWKTSLQRHLEKHNIKNKATSASGAYCAECDIRFSSMCSLQRHMRNSLKHVTYDQLKFICDHCKRRFADKTKLRDHIEEKHLHLTYQCDICQKTSKNRVGLEQHVRNVHKGRPNNKMCHHCGKVFPTKVQLESHIRTHTGERPFICEYCPTTFSQQSNLYKHHRQVHLNMKSKRYPLCNKKKIPGGNQTDNPPQSDCSNGHVPVSTGMYSVYYA